MPRRRLWLLCLAWLCSASARAADDQVNLAAGMWGATAWASSVYGPGYAATNALDGRWQRRETDKWNTAAGAGPHWLIIDLRRTAPVSRIVIRHEGALSEGEKYDTSDFQLQRGDSADGPWKDLVPPVRGNHDHVTTHTFAPTPLRWLRLWVTQGEQGANQFARIFEVEVYAAASDLTEPLVGIDWGAEPRFVTRAGELCQVGRLRVLGAVAPGTQVVVGPAGLRAELDAKGEAELTVLSPAKPTAEPAQVRLIAPGGRERQASIWWQVPARPYFVGGQAVITPSSHQDVAWMNTPDECARQRCDEVIGPTLDRMKREPGYCFAMEHTLALDEFLTRYPDRYEEVLARTREGRLEWGGTYTQPYEAQQSSEGLVRQFYLGRRWLRDRLPGCDTKVAFNPDVPGRTLQMPQLMARAGVPYLVHSRHQAGVDQWSSPDGSSIIAWSPGHYGIGAEGLVNDATKARPAIAAKLAEWTGYYRDHALPPVYCFYSSNDSSGPADYGKLLAEWDKTRANGGPTVLPSLRYATSGQFLDALTAGGPRLRQIAGERPNVWLYIHGPTHHWAISAAREAGWGLPAAETFATAACRVEGSYWGYPQAELNAAWKALCYPDHGWGGYRGVTTDAIFGARYEQARDTGRAVLDRVTRSLAERVAADAKRGRPLVVFNPLSWSRDDLVDRTLSLPAGWCRGLRVVDAAGQPVPSQTLAPVRYADGSLKSARLLFVARDVPSMGYRTWYLVPGVADKTEPAPPAERIETAAYRLSLAPGGIRSLFDKRVGRELLDSAKFLGGELFTMRSVGNGAGEFDRVQQPTMEGFDQLSRHKPVWKLAESGAVRWAWELEQPIDHVTVRQRIIVYRALPRIEIETDLLGWDGTQYREFRLAFPLAGANQASYEVPMGIVTIGRDELKEPAGERYTQPCAEVRPREVQQWMAGDDGRAGLMISSSVAVMDHLDPTDQPRPGLTLQPILLASRKSCHGQGNWYLQAGDHHYRFVLTGYQGTARTNWRLGVAGNVPLVTQSPASAAGRLPLAQSFFGIEAAGAMITTVKKAEGEDRAVARVVDYSGQSGTWALRGWPALLGAGRCNLIEDPLAPLTSADGSAALPLGHHAVETVRIW